MQVFYHIYGWTNFKAELREEPKGKKKRAATICLVAALASFNFRSSSTDSDLPEPVQRPSV